jgi:hypothetical protein
MTGAWRAQRGGCCNSLPCFRDSELACRYNVQDAIKSVLHANPELRLFDGEPCDVPIGIPISDASPIPTGVFSRVLAAARRGGCTAKEEEEGFVVSLGLLRSGLVSGETGSPGWNARLPAGSGSGR